MDTRGLMFLRGRPLHAPSEGCEARWLLPLTERDGRGTTDWTASWRGPEAQAFIAAHADALKAGCALNVELTSIRAAQLAVGAELRAKVTRLSLAPARWPAATAAANTNHQPQHSAA